MTEDAKLAEMRALVTERYGKGAPGDPFRQVFVAHAIDAADYARRLVDRADESADAGLAADCHVAATGRDLYFDSKLTPDELRSRFGDRVERMIAGMSDRIAESVYTQSVADFAEELCVIRLSDVIDNLATCTARIEYLDLRWVRDTFEPIIRTSLSTWTRPRYARYPKTGAILVRGLEHQHALLVEQIASVTELEATNALPARPKLTPADILVRREEREYREGWLVRGMRAFFVVGS